MDVVRPLKFENPGSGGTQFDYFPTEVNESEDYTIQHGVMIDNQNTFINRNVNGEISINDAYGINTVRKIINKSVALSIVLG